MKSLDTHRQKGIAVLTCLVIGVLPVLAGGIRNEDPDRIGVITNVQAGIVQRTSAVHELSDHLEASELHRLFQFLGRHSNERNAAGVRYLKNEVVTALRHQSTPPAGLTETLINVYQDTQQDSAVRDYALQHLACWYEEGAGDAYDSKSRIRLTLIAASESDSEIAATGLLGLHRLSLLDGSVEVERLNSTALRLAKISSASSVRVTAIQVCAERGCSSILPIIRSLAQSDNDSALRVSSIAALGQLGEATDLALLRRLRIGAIPSLKSAFETAVTKLERKNQNAF